MSKQNAARKFAMKARSYRAMALLFVIVGILLFAYMYTTKVQGHFMDAVKDPFTITVFFIPFLPAVFLSWLASSNEKKFNALMRLKK